MENKTLEDVVIKFEGVRDLLNMMLTGDYRDVDCRSGLALLRDTMDDCTDYLRDYLALNIE